MAVHGGFVEVSGTGSTSFSDVAELSTDIDRRPGPGLLDRGAGASPAEDEADEVEAAARAQAASTPPSTSPEGSGRP